MIDARRIPIGAKLSRPKMRGLIRHCGVYCGGGLVFENTLAAGGPRLVSLERFSWGRPVRVEAGPALPFPELRRRVRAELEQRRPYHLLFNNCEHAAARVREGVPRSPQVRGWSALFALAAAVLIAL